MMATIGSQERWESVHLTERQIQEEIGMIIDRASYRLVWNRKGLAPLAVAQLAASLTFYVPVSALFITSRGLTYGQIFWLESILLGTMMVVDIPSGVLGDRIDRRWVIVAGYAVSAAAQVVYALSHGFRDFAFSYCLSGIGIALLSGAEQAYVYESLGDQADQAATGVFGHFSALTIVAGVVASVSGAWIGSRDLAWPAACAAIAACCGVVATFFLPAQKPREPDHSEPQRGNLVSAIRSLVRSPVLIYVAFASSGGYVLFNAVYTINQPLFLGVSIPIPLWGIVGAGALGLAAVCNANASLLEEKLGRPLALFVGGITAGVGFSMMALHSVVTVVVGFLLVIVGWNARGPVTSAIVNRLVAAQNRATTLSAMNVLGSLAGMAINPAIGWLLDRDARLAAVGLGLAVGVISLIWLPVAHRYLVPTDPRRQVSDGRRFPMD